MKIKNRIYSTIVTLSKYFIPNYKILKILIDDLISNKLGNIFFYIMCCFYYHYYFKYEFFCEYILNLSRYIGVI